jgi:hypothetical protein
LSQNVSFWHASQAASSALKVNAINIEDILCSKTRLKVLRVLIGSQQTPPSEIVKIVGINFVKASQCLQIRV